jgi:hypothetical protein
MAIEADAMRAQIEDLSSRPSPQALRAQNSDLVQFIDESYSLLKAEGIHVQLDLDVDQDGRYRLRADSIDLMRDLKAALQEFDGNLAKVAPDR